MTVKSRATRLLDVQAKLTEMPERKSNLGTCFLQLDRLVRNLAVVGGLVLILIAVRNSSMPEAQSVFGAIRESAGMQWDESVGKLTFVNSLLPDEIREVWNEMQAITVFAPVSGEIVHAWSNSEPYLLIDGEVRDIRAAASGEVMSIAHGMDEERILRIRHQDGAETIYGNLRSCCVEVGTNVHAGDLIGTLISEKPLAFEVRINGRSIDPAMGMQPFEE